MPNYKTVNTSGFSKTSPGVTYSSLSGKPITKSSGEESETTHTDFDLFMQILIRKLVHLRYSGQKNRTYRIILEMGNYEDKEKTSSDSVPSTKISTPASPFTIKVGNSNVSPADVTVTLSTLFPKQEI